MKLVCPACSSDYEIADALLGPQGRKVRCASCSHVWRAQRAVPERTERLVEADTVMSEDDFLKEPAAQEAGGPEQDLGRSFSAALADRRGSLGAGADEPSARSLGDLGIDPSLGDPMLADVIASGPLGEVPVPRRSRFIKIGLKGKKKQAGASSRRERPATSAPPVWRAIALPGFVAAGLACLALAIPMREGVVRVLPDLAGLYSMIGYPVNIRGIAFSNVEAERRVVAGLPVLRIDGSMLNVSGRAMPVGPLRLALLGDDAQELFVWRVDPQIQTLGPGEALPIASELTAPPSNVASVSVRFLRDEDRLPGTLR